MQLKLIILFMIPLKLDHIIRTCPSCSSLKIVKYYSIKHHILLNYKFCNSCGLVFQSPTFNESIWNEFYKKWYRKLYNNEYKPTERVLDVQDKRAEFYFKYICSTIVLDGTINHLDIGSSAGLLLSKFRDNLNIDLSVGIEPGLDYHDSKANSGSKIYSSLEEILNDNIYFDIITICHVLEHIPNPNDFLKKCKTFLKPNGYLFIEVPNIEFSYLALEIAHPLCFSIQSLTSLLGLNGIEVISQMIHGQPKTFDQNYGSYIAVIAKKSNIQNVKINSVNRNQLLYNMIRNSSKGKSIFRRIFVFLNLLFNFFSNKLIR